MTQIVIAAAVCLCFVIGCDRELAFDGDGSISVLAGIGPREINDAVMVGAHVLVRTTGPRPLIVVFDKDGEPVAKIDNPGIFALAKGRNSESVLTQQATWFSLRTVPDLREVSRTKDEVFRDGAAGFFATNDGWVHIDINKALTIIRQDPLRIAAQMTVRTKPKTAAYDAHTNSVVIIGAPNTIETVDLAHMETRDVAQLGVRSVGFSSCVAQGRLWLDAEDGCVVGIDLATREVVARLHVETPGRRGSTVLGASASGDVLAIAARCRIDGKHHAELRVYALKREPQVIAAARAAGHVRTIEVIEDRRAVLVGATRPFMWEYGAKGG